MFKTIEIKIEGKKLIIDECDYRKYKNVIGTIKGFINDCLNDCSGEGEQEWEARKRCKAKPFYVDQFKIG